MYSILFFVVKLIYDFILKKKNDKLLIEGVWYHVHIPCYMGMEDYSYNQLSCGTTRVTRKLFDFTFVGDNRKFLLCEGQIVKKDQNTTHWYTKATKISDENDFDIIQVYEARTTGTQQKEIKECPCCKSKFEEPVIIQEAERFRHGIHKISIIDTDPKHIMMQAEYSDCYPSFKSGMLLFYRTEKERDDRVKEFFACAKMSKEQENI